MTNDKESNTKRREFRQGIPLIEWIVAGIGGVLVMASFGFLVYRAISEQEPPSFGFAIEKVQPMNEQQSVTVSIKNRGGRPVADVRVRAISGSGEEREAVIDYVPSQSRRVTFLFDQVVVAADVRFAVESFTEP